MENQYEYGYGAEPVVYNNGSYQITSVWQSSDSHQDQFAYEAHAAYVAYHSHIYEVMRVYMLGPLCLIGVVFNLVGVRFLDRDCTVPTATRFLLRMTAMADTGVLIALSTVIYIQRVLYSNGHSNTIKLTSIIIFSTLWHAISMAAVWCVVLVAAERYVTAWHPQLAYRFTNVPRLRLATIVIWIGSLAFNVPRFFEFAIDGPDLVLWMMGSRLTYLVVYRVFLYYVFHFFLPFSFLVFLVHRLIQSVRQKPASRQQLQQQVHDVSDEATTMIVDWTRTVNVVVVVVIVCLIIAHICEAHTLSLIFCVHVLSVPDTCSAVYISREMHWYVDIIGLLVSTISSSAKFVIYVARNPGFRLALRDLLACRRCSSRRPNVRLRQTKHENSPIFVESPTVTIAVPQDIQLADR